MAYDPNIADFLDESSVRLEMARVFQGCAGCRRCVDACPAFRDMFTALDLVGNEADRMTPHLQDQIADSCFDCGMCLQGCPYAPHLDSAWAEGIDVPSLMIRHRAMARERGLHGLRRRLADELAVRRGVAQRLARRIPRGSRNEPTNFHDWFLSRPRVHSINAQARVVFSSSCSLEFDDLRIGVDVVKAFEHNGVECSMLEKYVPCGCDALAVGDIGGFTRRASRNVRELSNVVDGGNDIVVLSPRCLDVMRTRYPQFIGGPETTKVIGNMYGPAEYLMLLRERQLLDLQFPGSRPESVRYQVSCPSRNVGEASATEALLRLAGIGVTRVDRCCEGRTCQDEVEVSGTGTVHPLHLLARVYGLAKE